MQGTRRAGFCAAALAALVALAGCGSDDNSDKGTDAKRPEQGFEGKTTPAKTPDFRAGVFTNGRSQVDIDQQGQLVYVDSIENRVGDDCEAFMDRERADPLIRADGSFVMEELWVRPHRGRDPGIVTGKMASDGNSVTVSWEAFAEGQCPSASNLVFKRSN